MTGAQRRRVWAPAVLAVAAMWSLAVFAVAAGFGPPLLDDQLAAALAAGPFLAFVSVTLIRPRSRTPSAVLWSAPWSRRSGVGSLLLLCVPGLVAAAGAAVCAYLGALWSWTAAPASGLGRILRGPDPYLGWDFPLVAAAAGVVAGCLFVLIVILPIGAAIDARRQWNNDRKEARRLLAFVLGAVGLGLTMLALVMRVLPESMDDGGSGQDRLLGAVTAFWSLEDLLLGRSETSPTGAAWASRVGVALMIVSLALYWHSREARTPSPETRRSRP